jgi:hypothetical protein
LPYRYAGRPVNQADKQDIVNRRDNILLIADPSYLEAPVFILDRATTYSVILQKRVKLNNTEMHSVVVGLFYVLFLKTA